MTAPTPTDSGGRYWAVVDKQTGHIAIFSDKNQAEKALLRRHDLGMTGYFLTRFQLVECAEGEGE